MSYLKKLKPAGMLNIFSPLACWAERIEDSRSRNISLELGQIKKTKFSQDPSTHFVRSGCQGVGVVRSVCQQIISFRWDLKCCSKIENIPHICCLLIYHNFNKLPSSLEGGFKGLSIVPPKPLLSTKTRFWQSSSVLPHYVFGVKLQNQWSFTPTQTSPLNDHCMEQ